jgi:aminoglycoside/choline kinase family phosphotransferase
LEKSKTTILQKLFFEWCGQNPENIYTFPKSGSNRQYYRLSNQNRSAIGVIGENQQENRAFLGFTEHFRNTGLNVPAILAQHSDGNIYLLEDLGDVSLFSMLGDFENGVSENIEDIYRQSLVQLIQFQIEGGKDLDYSLCFPRAQFDSQSIQWDLNYFKYYYLRPSGVDYNEQYLEDDFNKLIEYLLKADGNYFMFRDFQSRNIMVVENEPWFIDYQGGRKGPLQYDVVSLLFQAKANLPAYFREQMLSFYITELKKHIKINETLFREQYYGFILIRTLQVLGAYGYRGFFEQKPHFFESAKFAIQNLKWFWVNARLPIETPELDRCIKALTTEEAPAKQANKLTVEINSFSYLKSGIPKDNSGHGGGFVFDCRSLPNPGRYEEYKSLSGLDKAVIDFLEKEQAIHAYAENVLNITSQAIDNYIDRKFDHLSINFGCTGGQHRSVYNAERLYKDLKTKYDINITLNHLMKDQWR